MPFWAVLIAIAIPMGLVAAALFLERRSVWVSGHRRGLWIACALFQLAQIGLAYGSGEVSPPARIARIAGLVLAASMAVFDRPPKE